MTDQPRQFFFQPDGKWLVPQPLAKGPWGQTLHGRIFGALFAREVDSFLAEDAELICSRLTVDIFKPGAMAPVMVSSQVIRNGRRIVVLESTIEQENGAIAQGKAVLLRRSEQPEGELPSTPAWDVPTPLDPGTGLVRRDNRANAMWESWIIAEDGDRENRLRKGLWMRELHDLIEGEPLTPMVRLGAAGDVVHPVGNASTAGLGFINADYTMYLGREPRGDYIGIQPYGHISDAGVAAAQCIAHDLEGPFGFIATTAIANSMARANS